MSDQYYFTIPKTAHPLIAGKKVTCKGLSVGSIMSVGRFSEMTEDDMSQQNNIINMLKVIEEVVTVKTLQENGEPLFSQDEFNKLELDDAAEMFEAIMTARNKHDAALQKKSEKAGD